MLITRSKHQTHQHHQLLRKLGCARLPSEIRCLFCSEICFALCTGNRKKDAQGCGWRKAMVALQLRQTGQTNCGQHQVGGNKKRRKNEEKKTEIRRRINLDSFSGRGTQQSPPSTTKQQSTRQKSAKTTNKQSHKKNISGSSKTFSASHPGHNYVQQHAVGQ